MNLLPDHDPHLPSAPVHGWGHCDCHPTPTTRRLFTGLLAAGAALPALAQDGVAGDVGRISRVASLVPAEQIEAAGAAQYAQVKREAHGQGALVPADHEQVRRLRYIAQRILPHTAPWNARAARWQWEVNLIRNKQLNAFCMPGGKIAFYSGILVNLQLNDDEVAAIMGHEIAHALREHARERLGKTTATRIGANLISSYFGLGNLGDAALQMGAQLMTLRFSREDESEADLVGMELAARAGYDPAAGVTLWEKMAQASKGAPPQFLSTHPSGPTRIKDIRGALPKVANLVARAPKPDQRFPVASA
ncbi:MAG: M48 family metallopeptidase [Inhella sp.]